MINGLVLRSIAGAYWIARSRHRQVRSRAMTHEGRRCREPVPEHALGHHNAVCLPAICSAVPAAYDCGVFPTVIPASGNVYSLSCGDVGDLFSSSGGNSLLLISSVLINYALGVVIATARNDKK